MSLFRRILLLQQKYTKKKEVLTFGVAKGRKDTQTKGLDYIEC